MESHFSSPPESFELYSPFGWHALVRSLLLVECYPVRQQFVRRYVERSCITFRFGGSKRFHSSKLFANAASNYPNRVKLCSLDVTYWAFMLHALQIDVDQNISFVFSLHCKFASITIVMPLFRESSLIGPIRTHINNMILCNSHHHKCIEHFVFLRKLSSRRASHRWKLKVFMPRNFLSSVPAREGGIQSPQKSS